MPLWERVKKLWQRHDERLLERELGRESVQADINAEALQGEAPVAHTLGQLFDDEPLAESDPLPPKD